MYMNIGNAEYSVSTALTRLGKSGSIDVSTHTINSLCFQPTDILHERHHIRLVKITTCVSPYCQLGAAIHLRCRKSDQISELSRDMRSLLEYL